MPSGLDMFLNARLGDECLLAIVTNTHYCQVVIMHLRSSINSNKQALIYDTILYVKDFVLHCEQLTKDSDQNQIIYYVHFHLVLIL